MFNINSKDQLMFAYNDAREWFEQFESSFHEQSINNETILQALELCLLKIEEVIFLAKNDEERFMTILLNLRRQVEKQIYDVQQLIQFERNPTSNVKMFMEMSNTDSSFIPMDENKQTFDSEKNKIQDIIENTRVMPKVAGFDDVAGLENVKNILKTMVTLPIRQPQLFKNIKTGNCILLFGPPGTGKTIIVNALAAEAKITLHYITASSILSKYIGQTEKTVREIFQCIKNSEERIIFFIDEIDGLCRHRKDDESDHSRRLKTELMCQISDFEDCKKGFLICATNCPWDLDFAFIRRFQRRLYVPLPDIKERHNILKLYTKNTPLENTEVFWEKILKSTEGFSSTDMTNLIRCALTIPIMQLQTVKMWKLVDNAYYEPHNSVFGNDVIVTDLEQLPEGSVRARNASHLDLLEALKEISRTVSDTDIKKYEAYIQKAV